MISTNPPVFFIDNNLNVCEQMRTTQPRTPNRWPRNPRPANPLLNLRGNRWPRNPRPASVQAYLNPEIQDFGIHEFCNSGFWK